MDVTTMNQNIVIGLYGISGSGKSHTLATIQKQHIEWKCIEGRDIIEQIMKDQGKSFADFQVMDDFNKSNVRTAATKKINEYKGITVVVGHCSFPLGLDGNSCYKTNGSCCDNENNNKVPKIRFSDVFTREDAKTYNAIFYLDTEVNQVYTQRRNDTINCKRKREDINAEGLRQWNYHEKEVLKRQCEINNIYFSTLSPHKNDVGQELIKQVMKHFVDQMVNEARSTSRYALYEAIKMIPDADVYLLIDGDGTLVPQDTGRMFFNRVLNKDGYDPLKEIFQRYDGYTFQAFWEVSMLYNNITSTEEYRKLTHEIGSQDVDVYDAWINFLSKLPSNVHAVILSSSIREIWHATLSRHGLGEQVSIIAGNHMTLHRYIVDDTSKALVVTTLRQRGSVIISFGDSALDIPMLTASDRGYIVVNDRQNRSMKRFIEDNNMVESQNLGRHRPLLFQLNLGNTAADVLSWHVGIRVGCLNRLLDELLQRSIFQVYHFTEGLSAQILATQTRQANLEGPPLQKIHEQVGMYLADKLLDHFGGTLVEEDRFVHVQQGKMFSGTVTAKGVVIVAMMRSGDPLARGIYQRFTSASYIHYDDKLSCSTEALFEQFCGAQEPIKSIIIVDAVVNSGRSIRRVLDQLDMKLKQQQSNGVDMTIYVVTAVMQEETSLILPKEYPRIKFVALRVSKNKYTGKGGTDTGNRLFGSC